MESEIPENEEDILNVDYDPNEIFDVDEEGRPETSGRHWSVCHSPQTNIQKSSSSPADADIFSRKTSSSADEESDSFSDTLPNIFGDLNDEDDEEGSWRKESKSEFTLKPKASPRRGIPDSLDEVNVPNYRKEGGNLGRCRGRQYRKNYLSYRSTDSTFIHIGKVAIKPPPLPPPLAAPGYTAAVVPLILPPAVPAVPAPVFPVPGDHMDNRQIPYTIASQPHDVSLPFSGQILVNDSISGLGAKPSLPSVSRRLCDEAAKKDEWLSMTEDFIKNARCLHESQKLPVSTSRSSSFYKRRSYSSERREDQRTKSAATKDASHFSPEKKLKSIGRSSADEFGAEYFRMLEEQRKLREELNLRKELRRKREMRRRAGEVQAQVENHSGGFQCVSTFGRDAIPAACSTFVSIDPVLNVDSEGRLPFHLRAPPPVAAAIGLSIARGMSPRFTAPVGVAPNRVVSAPPPLNALPAVGARWPFEDGQRMKRFRTRQRRSRAFLSTPKSTLIRIRTVDDGAPPHRI